MGRRTQTDDVGKVSAKPNRDDLSTAAMMGIVGGAGLYGQFLNDETSRRAKAMSQLPHPDADARKALAAAGVVFGERIDDLFIQAVLPAGWTIKRTDHYMYSNLCDDRGRVRASIGIKMADSWAVLRSVARLTAGYMQDNYMIRGGPSVPCIKDSNDTVLWRGTPVRNNDAKVAAYYERCKAEKLASSVWKVPPHDYEVAQEVARLLLNRLYPDHADVLAYWDVDTFDKLPASESQPPSGKLYESRVVYYHPGTDHEADSGAGGSAMFENAAAAVAFFKAHHKDSHYTVKVAVTCEGAVVETFNAGAPRRRDRLALGWGDSGEFGEACPYQTSPRRRWSTPR